VSTIGTLRTGIKAAIAGVSALSAVQVYDAAIPAHAYALALRKPALVLSYRGRRKLDDGPLTSRDRYRMVYQWTITLVAQDWREPAGAVTRTLGIEEMAEALDAIRLVSIGTVGDETVYPVFESETIDVPGDRGDEGGPASIVQEWTTTEVLI